MKQKIFYFNIFNYYKCGFICIGSYLCNDILYKVNRGIGKKYVFKSLGIILFKIVIIFLIGEVCLLM